MAQPTTTATRLSPAHSMSSLHLVEASSGGVVDWMASGPGSSLDPRSSSTQSLAPSEREQRRTLLIIYVHGFMGDDSSFRSFPAHVHNFLKSVLADTHVIHSKIYPRYKTYKAIEVATDNFSTWLEPHESPTTDIILVGHSMGGLLAADVVLQPTQPPVYGSPFRHRILGTISLDAPLLGLHPGIVVSGITSLFRPAPGLPPAPGRAEGLTPGFAPAGPCSPNLSIYSEQTSSSPSQSLGGMSTPSLMTSTSSSSAQPQGLDPFFNPAFFNDASFVDRGWLKNVVHFAQKHKAENLFGAAASHILSHLEFGGCLADYSGLKLRYTKLRKLEDVNDLNPLSGGIRVRFINYYTISTGIPKKKQPGYFPDTKSLDAGASQPVTPRILIKNHSDSGVSPAALEMLEPIPEPESPDRTPAALWQESQLSLQPAEAIETEAFGDPDALALPPIPNLPSPPPAAPDFTSIQDKEARKQAEKEAKRAQKAYEQAVKSREKTIKERQKLAEKQRRKGLKDAEKRERDAQKERDKLEQKEQKRLQKEEQAALKQQQQQASQGGGGESGEAAAAAEPKKKLRKFCMLPGKNSSTGERDTAWVPVHMEGVDEVGAHCGLFFAEGAHYEKLVSDVGTRIAAWVHEDASRRAIADLD
ncbi:hypothetical protein B0T26DRAFT_848606 [Lasiosphaeria miniovina]|uniref:DUF676 domain-containing protein n=1 Tax=Lasiosphaeria miniovina TaxID=1954250 RepID=A0AA40B5X7_9PEZI|nr:uncharacterized protein B0T26DRAFT_848606 [Lasiosphaeria miniovina]KAK0728290.1 hypothetical protein B0T26DRAFT_848606 [Lasiosphaeria miniovina]